MNARSRNKQAAWEFIEWATGKEFLLRSAMEGNMNPTRASMRDDPTFIVYTCPWGDFRKISRQLAEQIGEVLVTPATNYLRAANR